MKYGHEVLLRQFPEGPYKERLRVICEELDEPTIVHSPAYYEAKSLRFTVSDYTPWTPGEC